MSNHISRSLDERDSLGNSFNLEAKAFCKVSDVSDGIATSQTGELVQWEHYLFEERTKCLVLPNAGYSEYLRLRVSKC